jgi:predicted DNA-binding antitoxin AbrB/MazE fold protein
MTKIIEAIFSNGVFRPVEPFSLQEQERVRLTVETVGPAANGEGNAARKALIEGMKRSIFRSTGPYPLRDELHERR